MLLREISRRIFKSSLKDQSTQLEDQIMLKPSEVKMNTMITRRSGKRKEPEDMSSSKKPKKTKVSKTNKLSLGEAVVERKQLPKEVQEISTNLKADQPITSIDTQSQEKLTKPTKDNFVVSKEDFDRVLKEMLRTKPSRTEQYIWNTQKILQGV